MKDLTDRRGIAGPRAGVLARLVHGRGLEAALLLAGLVLVLVGAGPARAEPGALQVALYVVVLLLGLGAVGLALAAPAVRRVVALEALLLLVVAVPFTRIPSAGELIASVGLVVVALTAIALVRGGPLPRGWWLAAALIVVLAAATALAPDRYGLLRFAPFALVFGAVFLLFGGAGRADRQRVLRFAVVLAVVQAVLAVAEPLLGSPRLWASAKITADGVEKALRNPLLPGLERSQGTLGHPLALGVLLVVAVALLVRDAAELSARTRLVAAVPLAAGLVLSGSRNSIALAVLLTLVFVPRWRFGRRAVAMISALVVALVAAVLVAAPVVEAVLASGSTTHRTGALEAVPGLLTEQSPLRVLLGNGWASSARMFGDGLLQNDGLRAVDNELVLLLSQGGLVAVALFIALVVLALRRAERSLLPVVLVLAVTALVFDVLAWPSAAALTAIALSSAPAREHRHRAPQVRRPARATAP